MAIWTRQDKIEKSVEMACPDCNLNLCLVGGVSTGKSTSLNALFLKDLSECKIKRTTMVPTIYVETAAEFPLDHYAEIYAKVAETNADLIAKSESGNVNKADYKELVFEVGKLDVDIAGCLFNVYDIPGLNDARTKTVYMDYLTAKFAKFNVVVLFVDIMSGLNTSDEMEIVRFLAKNTALHHAAGRDIYTLVVVNKADDMQLGADGALSLTGEMADMFAQVERTVRAEFSAVPDHVIGIIPLCALDAYLYRMVREHGRDFYLTPQQVLKIGVNEQGKKFSKLSPATQEKKVRDILEDEKFIGDMIQLSGFKGLEQTLQLFLQTKFTKMSTDNLLMQLKDAGPALDKALATPEVPWVLKHLKKGTNEQAVSNSLAAAALVQAHLDVYKELRKINKTKSAECTLALYEKLRLVNYAQFMKYQEKICLEKNRNTIDIVRLTILLEIYDDFREYCEEIFPDEIVHFDKYPPDIVAAGFCAVLKTDLSNIEFLDKIGCLDLGHVDQFLQSWFEWAEPLDVISVPLPQVDPEKMAAFVKKLRIWNPTLEALGVNMELFMRGVVIKFTDTICRARLSSCNWVGFGAENYIRQLIYTTAGEIPVRLFLDTLPKEKPYGTCVEIMDMMKKDHRADPRFALDFMYLDYC